MLLEAQLCSKQLLPWLSHVLIVKTYWITCIIRYLTGPALPSTEKKRPQKTDPPTLSVFIHDKIVTAKKQGAYVCSC